MVHARHTITLIRSGEDKNCYELKDPKDAVEEYSIKLNHVSWKLPFVYPSPRQNLDLSQKIEKGLWIKLPFRTWELFGYSLLPPTNTQTWTVKSTTELEKPRYIILGFQTDRRGKVTKSASEFDHCDLADVKVYINEEVYPYGNLNLNFKKKDFSELYNMYALFRPSYYGKGKKPLLYPSQFKKKAPLAVIDCSHQADNLKTGPVNFRIEFRADTAFPAATTAYALVIHDRIVDYNILNNQVSKM